MEKSDRVISIDVYRGFVMFLMMAEVFSFGSVSEALPESSFWAFLDWNQSHVRWIGCSLHDMIQPSFSFLVGVVVPYSISSRLKKGDSFRQILFHTLKRALILILLGIFLRSMHRTQTNFTFEDTLTQIGLGYPFLVAIAVFSRSDMRRVGWSIGIILVGYWLAFAMYPLPDAYFDWTQTGVDPAWPGNLTGFAAHWNKNTNFAWAFDQWFLNLFPREKYFQFNGGGYSTLSFIPTLATMLLGLTAGFMMKNQIDPGKLIRKYLMAGVVLLAASLLLHFTGLCPIVKRIWTPSWVLFSGGICFGFLALFHWITEIRLIRNPFYFFLVIGANSIMAYLLADGFAGFIRQSFEIHLGSAYSLVFGAAFESLVSGFLIFGVEWLILRWMFRHRIFIKI